MAAKFGYEAIKYVLTKVLTKKGVKGIATIPGKAYDMRMKQLVDEMAFKMKALGYDINKVTQKEVQGLLDSAEALAKQKKPKVISQGDPEFQGITDKVLGKQKPTTESLLKGEKYTDDRGRTWDFGTKDRPFPGANLKEVKTTKKDRPSIRLMKNFEKELTDIDLAKEGYNLQEIGILKKARNVMKKEGQNPDDALSWVRSEMADDAGIDFEDFMTDFDWGDFPGKAEGGRIGYAGGGIFKLLKMLKPKPKPKPKREKIYGVGGKEIDVADLKKKIGLDAESLKKDDEAFKLRLQQILAKHSTKHADGGRIGMMYGGDPGFAFEYGGSWADWHDQHRDQMPVEQYIKTRLPKDRLPFREMQSGGLAYMLGEPTYGVGGSVGHAPWLKPTGQQAPEGQNETPPPQIASRPDPMKAPRGIPSLAPKNMDPAFMQQQMMQKAMMGRGNTGQGPRPMAKAGGRIGFGEGTPKIPEQFLEDLKKRDYHEFLEKYRRWKENYERRKDLAPTQEAAEGGIMRMGFKKGGDMSRRGFMKLIAGIAALPVIGKYFKLAKPAAKAVEAAVTFEKTAGMPAWFPALVNRIIKEGDEVTKKLGTVEREIVHTKSISKTEDITVYRNLDTGNVRVEYGSPEFDKTGKVIRASNDEGVVHLEYRAGEVIDEGKHAGKKTDPEFRAAESEPEVVNWDGDIEWSGTNEVNIVDDLVSDTSKLEEFATGKPLNITKRLTSERKLKYKDKLEKDTMEQIDYIEKKRGPFPDPGDYSLDADEMAEVIPKWQGKASGGLAGLLGE